MTGSDPVVGLRLKKSNKMKSKKTALSFMLPKKMKLMAKKSRPVIQELEKKFKNLNEIHQEIGDCKRCKLSKGRTHIVLGEGSESAKLVFVGEAPGESEDLEGKPFIGRSGQLLEKMINAMGLKRSEVFICNVVKCRPPENRNPENDEVGSCAPYLLAQLSVLKPKVIVALGKFASQTLLQTNTEISELRGRFHDFRGVKLMPTFHPAYLLRSPSSKKDAWEDLKIVAKELGLPPLG